MRQSFKTPDLEKPLVDVIVPVYRGLGQTRDCLRSVLESKQSTPFELIIINDASPEDELTDYLRSLSDSGAITLLENAENLGFVSTINRGIALHPDRDVVLLNSDTRVNGDWLDRLKTCAYRKDNIGTVTPLSNNATICSYPRFCEDNELPENLVDIDRLCRLANAGQDVDIPTAVGFCMFIRRICLDTTGEFDEVRFGKGYGEENDFCLRATARSWQHKLAIDTFVFHQGGVSFADTQHALKQQAGVVMRQLHPAYDQLVQRHIENDPARVARLMVDLLRLAKSPLPLLLLVSHGRNGGTEKHIQELAVLLSSKANVLVLKPDGAGLTTLEWAKSGEGFHLFIGQGDYADLVLLLKAVGCSRVHYHHTLDVPQEFMSLSVDLGVPYDFTVHDYYLACPRTNMLNVHNEYCREPEEAGCNTCLQQSPQTAATDVKLWREAGGELLNGAQRVFLPSADTERRMRRYFPQAKFIRAPHADLPRNFVAPPIVSRSRPDGHPLRVLVLGALAPVKGADLLEAAAMDARERGLPVEFRLLGHSYRHLVLSPKSALRIHGAYQDHDLPDLIASIDPDLVWFPTRGPETYSYTLSICLRLGLPVAATDLGAFPERLAERCQSWVLPWDTTAPKWNDFFVQLFSKSKHENHERAPLSDMSSNLDFDYREDYLPKAPRKAGSQTEVLALRAVLKRLAFPRESQQPANACAANRVLLPAASAPNALPLVQAITARLPTRWQARVRSWLLGR